MHPKPAPACPTSPPENASILGARFRLTLCGLAAAVIAVGCGGGGDEVPVKGPYFAVEGATSVGGLSYTACIEGIELLDPASIKGLEIAANLAAYYQFVGAYRSFGGDGQTCRERFPTLSALLTVSDYNNTVLPALAAAPPPAPAPAPAPAPPPVSPRTCGATDGSGVDGLQLFGQASYNNLPGTSSTAGTVTLDPGEISYSDPALTSTSRSGSLRATLWAVPGSYNGGTISGTIVSRYAIEFTDGSNQLLNGQSSNLVAATISANTPARGSYCMVVTLDEYDPATCSSTDGYCVVDWQQFPSSSEFQ